MTEIQELREIVQAQAKRLTDTRAIAQLNEYRDEQIQEQVRALENTLAATRCHIDVLTRLVERMGCDLNTFWWGDNLPDHPYTLIGQRQYDAAMHESEGAPPTRESEGAWGYE